MIRRTYSYGHKTREAAQDALNDLLAESEVSMCEKPEIGSYPTANGKRWRITLAS